MCKKILVAIIFVIICHQLAFGSENPFTRFSGEFGPEKSVYGQRLGSIYNFRNIYNEIKRHTDIGLNYENTYYFHSSGSNLRFHLNWIDPEEIEGYEVGTPDIFSVFLLDKKVPQKIKNEFEGNAYTEEDIIKKMSDFGYTLVKKKFGYFNREYNTYDIYIVAMPDRISSILFSSNIVGARNVTQSKFTSLMMKEFNIPYGDQDKLTWGENRNSIIYKEDEKGYEMIFTVPDLNRENRVLVELKAIEVFSGLSF